MLTMLNGKAGGMWHTEWFMQKTGSHSSVVEDRGLLECDCITFPPDILKNHCAYILRSKQSKNQSTCVEAQLSSSLNLCHPHVTQFTRCIFDITGLLNEMHTVHLMQQLPCVLKVYLHALVNNADYPFNVTYLVIFTIVQSTYSKILLCKMADASKWIWTEERASNDDDDKTTTQ
jgi:hypothetical protein